MIKRLEKHLKDDAKTPWETSMLYDSKKGGRGDIAAFSWTHPLFHENHDQDIEHEGANLEAGSKRILTVNLWARRQMLVDFSS